MNKQIITENQVCKLNFYDNNDIISPVTTMSFSPLYSSSSWSVTEVVSTESIDNSFVSSLYTDGNGTVHVAWHDHTNYAGSGIDSDIFYKYKPSSGSWSITEVVSTESTGSSEQPSLMVDNVGTVHVAWMDETNYGGNDNAYDVFYKYKPSDSSWSITEVVSTESTNYAWWPSLWIDDECTVHVTWEDWTNYGGSGSDTDIFYKYKPSGGSWSITEVVSTESSSFSEQVSIMVDVYGTVHIAWDDGTDYGGSGSDYDVFYKYKLSGGSWSVTEVVSTESTGHSGRPSLKVDDDGIVHIAWEDLTDYISSGTDKDIFYKYKLSGGSWSFTEVVSSESTSFSWSPSLWVDSDSIVHVAWDDGTDYGGSDSDDDIFYKYKSSIGSWNITEVVSTESTDTSWWPSLMVDNVGAIHVAWHDWTDYGSSGSDRDIFYKYKTSPLNANAHGPYYGKLYEPITFIGSANGGIPPYSWLWFFGDGNTSHEQNSIYNYYSTGNYTVILTVTDDTGEFADDITWAYIYQENNPPNIPNIDGPSSGKPDVELCWTINSTDPDGDDIYYYVDWGDGTNTGWIGPYPSSTQAEVCHTYENKGIYIIKVKVKDIYNPDSDWAEFKVTIPRSKELFDLLILRFIERFPMMKRLLFLLK